MRCFVVGTKDTIGKDAATRSVGQTQILELEFAKSEKELGPLLRQLPFILESRILHKTKSRELFQLHYC